MASSEGTRPAGCLCREAAQTRGGKEVPEADYWAEGGSDGTFPADRDGRGRPPFWDARDWPTVERGTLSAMAICLTLRPLARMATARATSSFPMRRGAPSARQQTRPGPGRRRSAR